MKKLFAISLALILALGMFSVAAAEDVITIGFAQVGHESDWRAANTLDYQNTFTAENGYELLFVDADNDHTAQMEAVRNFIQQEVDYIVICPVQEAGWDVVLQEAQDAGIPVIIADRTVSADPSLYSCFIGTDSAAEGVQAGEWLAEQLDGAEANILVIEGSVGASAAIGRSAARKRSVSAASCARMASMPVSDRKPSAACRPARPGRFMVPASKRSGRKSGMNSVWLMLPVPPAISGVS